MVAVISIVCLDLVADVLLLFAAVAVVCVSYSRTFAFFRHTLNILDYLLKQFLFVSLIIANSLALKIYMLQR